MGSEAPLSKAGGVQSAQREKEKAGCQGQRGLLRGALHVDIKPRL